ncbi:hypothetical protein [Methylobacterium iners]|nr:hypothetical protein [Methylobacterium iners]
MVDLLTGSRTTGGDAAMAELDAKREEIAGLIAQELGLGDLSSLNPSERATVDQQTAETIEGCGDDAAEPADCTEATLRLRQVLKEYRDLETLRSDELDARLAEEGEVFAREDDA